ncbi:MAG: FAD binding domain-containing protein [Actinomycetota bacterium]
MITRYERPKMMDEALGLLTNPDAVILAGGTVLNASSDRAPVTAVDLQGLGLSGIEAIDGGVRVGAMATLQDLADSDLVPPVLRELAHHEAPNTIRNAATVGGTIAAADSLNHLLAGLLAFEASANIARVDSTTTHSVEETLAHPALLAGGIITDISIPTGGTAVSDRTGRTPMDTPIVAAVAHRDATGETRLAMTGVGSTPLLVDPEHLEELDPPADFRGSSAYRSQLAQVLAGRVLDAVSGGAS